MQGSYLLLYTDTRAVVTESTPLTVHLLAAVKVPARHGRTMRIRVEIPE